MQSQWINFKFNFIWVFDFSLVHCNEPRTISLLLQFNVSFNVSCSCGCVYGIVVPLIRLIIVVKAVSSGVWARGMAMHWNQTWITILHHLHSVSLCLYNQNRNPKVTDALSKQMASVSCGMSISYNTLLIGLLLRKRFFLIYVIWIRCQKKDHFGSVWILNFVQCNISLSFANTNQQMFIVQKWILNREINLLWLYSFIVYSHCQYQICRNEYGTKRIALNAISYNIDIPKPPV